MKNIKILTVLCGGIIGCSANDQCESFIRRTEVNQEYSGVVFDAYFKESDGGRGTPTIVWRDKSRTYVASNMLICYLGRGDSVNKPIGSLKTFVYRKDSVKVFYPDCGEFLILDNNQLTPNPQFGIDCGKRK